MEVLFYDTGEVDESMLEFVVIAAIYKGKWLFVRHNERDTWELPGGHREAGEMIEITASKELNEKTGAENFIISPVCDYSVSERGIIRYGRLFVSNIKLLGCVPNMGIGEVGQFEHIPERLTYPEIQHFLFDMVKRYRLDIA